MGLSPPLLFLASFPFLALAPWAGKICILVFLSLGSHVVYKVLSLGVLSISLMVLSAACWRSYHKSPEKALGPDL